MAGGLTLEALRAREKKKVDNFATEAKVMWRLHDGAWKAFIVHNKRAQPVVWAAQPGSQKAFLSCPIYEALYEGNRGPGKTDALIMDYLRDVGKGWGAEWRGVLFRRTYPELDDVIQKSKKWIPLLFPTAKFNESKTFWEFESGERLYFRHFMKPSDYWSYHGHAYPWIAWEELTTWPDDSCYRSMFSTSRSTMPGMPKRIRATTNPYGIGHNWVKDRFRLPLRKGRIVGPVIRDAKDLMGEAEPPRVAIHGELKENRILLTSDPDYVQRIRASAESEAMFQAWVLGSWDIFSGGILDDIWAKARDHVVMPRFAVPSNWRIIRSYDWGSSKPFSVGWWAISNGEDLLLPDGSHMATVRGDLFRVNEWYGWTGRPNTGVKMLDPEISAGIVEREIGWSWRGKGFCRVTPGPADASIFDEKSGKSTADDMAEPVRIDGLMYNGITWEPADKRKGSRIWGWNALRKMLKATIPTKGPREEPAMFVCEHCTQWLRTVPKLPRDIKNPDDVDSDAEDHIGDETRYVARYEAGFVGASRNKGTY